MRMNLHAPSTSSQQKLRQNSQTGTAVGSSEETKSGEQRRGSTGERKTEENA
jgi:hypothetical protein